MNRLVRFALTGLLICCMSSCGLKAEKVDFAAEIFFEANRDYGNGQFQKAVDGYLELIEMGFDTGHLFYNLGNAYFRLGETGKAILCYEKAHLLIPRNDDLAFNLAYAKDQVVDAVDDFRTIPLTNFIGLDSLNLHEVFFIFSVVNILFFALIGIRLFKKVEWSYYLSIFSAIVISISACALVLKWYGSVADDRAVILSEEAVVRAGPDTKDTVLFKIHQGTVVHYERKEGDWVLLGLSKDKRGWVESRHIEQIVKTG